MKIKMSIIVLFLAIILVLFLNPQKKEDLIDIKIKAELFTSFEVNKKVKIYSLEGLFYLEAFLKEINEEYVVLKVYEKDLKNFNFQESYFIYPLINHEQEELIY